MSGTLYVCATPIGNLEDITLRALRVLSQVDRIVGEDSRRTRRLLTHHHIRTPFASSLYEGVERERTGTVTQLLKAGEDIALVSDAGTPLISDPGYLLVRECVRQGITVVPVPGPSAPLAALVASGLPTDRFLFLGSLPRKASPRRRALEELQGLDCTAIALSSPHRLQDTLEVLASMYPSRSLVVARELTKVHEEYLRGTSQEVLEQIRAQERVRGEVVLVIGADERPQSDRADEVPQVYRSLLDIGLSPGEALRQAAKIACLSRKEAYDIVHRAGDPPDE